MLIENWGQSPELNAERLNVQFQEQLAQDQWDQAAILLEQNQHNSNLDTTQVYQKLMEQVDEKGKQLEQNYAGEKDYKLDFYIQNQEQSIQLITQGLVDRLSKTEVGLNYLSTTIAGQDSIPRAYLLAADFRQDRSESEDLSHFHYYNLVTDSLIGNKSPQALELLKQILAQTERDSQEYIDEQGQKYPPRNPEMDIPTESEQEAYDQVEEYGEFERELYLGLTVKSKVLQALAETKNPEAINIAVDFIKHELVDAPLYIRPVLHILESINPKLAAEQLLSLARSNDAIEKRIALSLLYRLESGKINISEQGLDYLGKTYDLGDLSRPDYFAQRITGQGDIGVFKAGSKTMERYFRLSGLDSEQETLRPELLEMTYKTFLFGRNKETEKDKQQRQAFLAEFQNNYFEYFDQELFGSRSKISFRDLSFSEQAAAVSFLDQYPDEGSQLLSQLAEKYGLNGVKTVLSLEQDSVKELIKNSLSYSEQSDSATRSLELLFSRYSFIVGMADSVDNYLADNFPEQVSDNPDLVIEVKQNILHRASLTLQTSLSKLDQANIENCIRRLDSMQAEAVVSAQTIKALLEQGQDLESIRGINIEQMSGPELSSEDATRLQEIYKDNWQLKTTPEYLQLLQKNFAESLKDPVSRFKILRYNNQITAFVVFEDSRDAQGQRYIHGKSLNVELSFQAGKIAEVFLSSAVEQEAGRGLPVRAETSTNNSMLKKYLDMGFKEIGQSNVQGESTILLERSAKQ